MAIIYQENKKIFTIHTENSTYQMQVDSYGFLLHLYYGKKTEDEMDYLLTYADRGFSGNPYDAGGDRTYSMDVLPQEFPCLGTGDYRNTALAVKNPDGSYSCDLRYRQHSIKAGKYALEGLPAVYSSGESAQTLEICMEDLASGLQVRLLYGVLPELDIITRSVIIENGGEHELILKRVQTACLDFLYGDYDVISFYGRHAMERNYQRSKVGHGTFRIGSTRGTSSHQYSPLLILAENGADEDWGDCYGMNFVYSGGFKGEVEKDQYNQTRMLMGLSDELFSYPLKPGEHFVGPEVILTYSREGLGRLSQNYHKCIREHVCRGKYRDCPRPILINSWEASYYDFSGDSIYELAKEASELGIEMLVLDDGWFGARSDDNTGLGDWYVNEEKLGCTLGNLIQRINRLGMKFGLWIEPEMVSEESELYRSHADWALAIPGRKPVRGRNQLVLDFSRKEVVDGIYEQLCAVLDQGNIEYIKWDMNRSIADVYSASARDQGQVLYDYVQGLYDLLERICIRYPNILIEGCSGGGGRFDAGMLYYTPQIWCSDNTDAIDRLSIQYGTSFGFPVSAVGSHVSAVPNHQTGRNTSLKTRGITAMAGTFGYELDPGALSSEEKEEIRRQVRDYRRYASLIRNGLYYRLSNPDESQIGAWCFVSEDGREALLNVVMVEIHGNMTVNYVRLKGLKENSVYREESTGKCYKGSSLMAAGIPLPVEMGEYQSYQMHFEMV